MQPGQSIRDERSAPIARDERASHIRLFGIVTIEQEGAGAVPGVAHIASSEGPYHLPFVDMADPNAADQLRAIIGNTILGKENRP